MTVKLTTNDYTKYETFMPNEFLLMMRFGRMTDEDSYHFRGATRKIKTNRTFAILVLNLFASSLMWIDTNLKYSGTLL